MVIERFLHDFTQSIAFKKFKSCNHVPVLGLFIVDKSKILSLGFWEQNSHKSYKTSSWIHINHIIKVEWKSISGFFGFLFILCMRVKMNITSWLRRWNKSSKKTLVTFSHDFSSHFFLVLSYNNNCSTTKLEFEELNENPERCAQSRSIPAQT